VGISVQERAAAAETPFGVATIEELPELLKTEVGHPKQAAHPA